MAGGVRHETNSAARAPRAPRPCEPGPPVPGRPGSGGPVNTQGSAHGASGQSSVEVVADAQRPIIVARPGSDPTACRACEPERPIDESEQQAFQAKRPRADKTFPCGTGLRGVQLPEISKETDGDRCKPPPSHDHRFPRAARVHPRVGQHRTIRRNRPARRVPASGRPCGRAVGSYERRSRVLPVERRVAVHRAAGRHGHPTASWKPERRRAFRELPSHADLKRLLDAGLALHDAHGIRERPRRRQLRDHRTPAAHEEFVELLVPAIAREAPDQHAAEGAKRGQIAEAVRRHYLDVQVAMLFEHEGNRGRPVAPSLELEREPLNIAAAQHYEGPQPDAAPTGSRRAPVHPEAPGVIPMKSRTTCAERLPSCQRRAYSRPATAAARWRSGSLRTARSNPSSVSAVASKIGRSPLRRARTRSAT